MCITYYFTMYWYFITSLPWNDRHSMLIKIIYFKQRILLYGVGDLILNILYKIYELICYWTIKIWAKIFVFCFNSVILWKNIFLRRHIWNWPLIFFYFIFRFSFFFEITLETKTKKNGKKIISIEIDHILLQFWLTLHYLFTMSEEQTLVMYSGHPMGLFPSSPDNPR